MSLPVAPGLQADTLPSYDRYLADFDFQALAAEVLSGSLSDGLNACIECCDRHATDPARVALEWENKDGARETVTFAELSRRSARFANILTAHGIKPGDRVAGLLPRIPDLLTVILGTWRAGAVYQPLFTAFGPKAIEHRCLGSAAKLIVTDATNRPKLDDVHDCPPVATLGAPRDGDIDLAAAMAAAPDQFTPVLRKGSDAFLMMFTSGTTGLPKGVAVPLQALVAFYEYMRFSVDLRSSDRFWNIADPGWAYGLYYAVTGPLLMGHATTFYDGPFTVESTYRLIQQHGITNLAGAPTAYRLLMGAGAEAAAAIKGKLRVVSSAGEPLNPEVIRWFDQALSAPIHDHYGQTEMGMAVCNHHALAHPVEAGSAGLPLPGFTIAVIDEDTLQPLPPHQPGILAVVRSQSPGFWFQGYWQQGTKAFRDDYYLTGDTVEWNEDGSISFVGRSDDIITSSGYRIGPFDVESALIEHKSVAETAVIGKPDPERTEIVKAFVVLKKGYDGTDELAEELRLWVRNRLAAHAYPRELVFVDELPKTPSGKIQRFLLRKQESDNA
ncbi:AMP-binding protein [Insolitispirillum peregrinum]|uniref:Acetyl-CoA synthetase n=1 Tax=Insolitispirillum peregrinum TaxID=80876 RepID=A0A1N7K1W4_9PROT|nr:AMP-binding protein [Insolitispirillum peregrinum]SIS55582.1 acetyl-CoA synthetase [Insolitispirillum peregrinum]